MNPSMYCSTTGLPIHHQLSEFTQTHVHKVGDAVQSSHPLLSPYPPAFNLSQHQGLFKWFTSSHQVGKYWNFSFSISPSNECSGLISFRMDWLALVQVTEWTCPSPRSTAPSCRPWRALRNPEANSQVSSLWENPAYFRQLLLEKAMAPHSNTLAWKIPWTEEPGRLQSMGSLSRTRLSNFTFTFRFYALEKEMATHSSVLAWRIPGTVGPGGLPSMGSHRVGHDWSDLAAAAAAAFKKMCTY